jgi:hypothetical protein
VRIRVFLGPMPAILRDILNETLGSQDDVILVGAGSEDSALRDGVATLSPDVVVVGVEQLDAAGGYVDLFRDHLDLRLLAIRNDVRSAAIHEFRIRRCQVAELSSATILAAVRGGCDGLPSHASPANADERV